MELEPPIPNLSGQLVLFRTRHFSVFLPHASATAVCQFSLLEHLDGFWAGSITPFPSLVRELIRIRDSETEADLNEAGRAADAHAYS